MLRLLIAVAALAAAFSSPAEAQTTAQPAKIYSSSSPITPGTAVQPGIAVALSCSVAGTVRLVMSDGTFLDFYATQGTAIVDNLSVRDVNAAGTTGTCTVSVLRGY